MWKKLACLTVCAALLLFCSCKAPASKGADGRPPCPIEALQWGMSLEECLAALSLTEADVTLEKKENNGEITLRAELSGYRSYGYPVKGAARLIFFEDLYGLSIGLHNVLITFDPSVSFEALNAAVAEQVGSYGMVESLPDRVVSNFKTKKCFYQTEKTLADADQALVDKYLWDKWRPGSAASAGLSEPKKETRPLAAIWVGGFSDNVVLITDTLGSVFLEEAEKAESSAK